MPSSRKEQRISVIAIIAVTLLLMWMFGAFKAFGEEKEKFQVGETYLLRGLVCDTVEQIEEVVKNNSNMRETVAKINQRDGKNSCVVLATLYRYEGELKTFELDGWVWTIHKLVPVLWPEEPQPVWYSVSREKRTI